MDRSRFRDVSRIIALFLLWTIPAAIFTAAFHYDWRAVWSSVGVHSYAPPFLDLRSLPAAVRTVQQGGDPLVANPNDTLQRPLNYPRIWLYAFSLLHINERNVWVVGLLFAGLYLLCVSKLVLQGQTAWEHLALLVAGLSIAPLFAFERGSTDLAVFAIVFGGCCLPKAWQRSGMFLLGTLLKLFPIAALAADAGRQRGKNRVWPVTLLMVAGALLAAQWRDLILIQRGTPVTMAASYGVSSLRETIWYSMTRHALLSPAAVGIACTTAVLSCWIAAFWIGFRAWKRSSGLDQKALESPAAGLFFIFGAIYVFSFAIGSNWDYRLIFLLPTLPFAFEAVREPARAKWAVAYIVSALCTENVVAFEGGYKVLLAQAFTIATFLLIVPVLLEQLKSRLFPEKMAGPVATTECA